MTRNEPFPKGRFGTVWVYGWAVGASKWLVSGYAVVDAESQISPT